MSFRPVNIKTPFTIAVGVAKDRKKNKKPILKTVTAVAACFVVVILAFSGIAGSMLSAEKGDVVADAEGFYNGASQIQVQYSASNTAGEAPSERKIVKTAQISIKTKSNDTFLADIKQKIEQYGGYIEQSHEYNYNSLLTEMPVWT